MTQRSSVTYLFNLTTDIEQSFQCPIIFFTETDFTEFIYQALDYMTQAVKEKASPEAVYELVKKFHYNWLYEVKKIVTYKKNLKVIPREAILRTIDFTINCLENRYAYLQNNIGVKKTSLTHDEHEVIAANLDIISELRQIHHNALLEKKEKIINQADQKEYFTYINNEVEELLIWLDWQYDNLAIQHSKVLDLHVPIVQSDLTKVFKNVVDEISIAPDPDSQRMLGIINLRSKASQTLALRSLQSQEITRLELKIKSLEDRISKLEDQHSPALMALQHRTLYLKEKVESLQNMQQSINRLKEEASYMELNHAESAEERIFNHSLPPHLRARLVERLLHIWDGAIMIRSHESIISILSVADLKEVFSDEKGQFTVDKYGRKIYSKDNELYQLNDKNELVLVKDDEGRPYFYDECGRYYLNAKSHRIYKAHDDASEYFLSSRGTLFKVKEVVNGTEYFYDCLGRYYINEKGKNIYHEKDTDSEYEYDGISNLVKISKTKYYYGPYVKKPFSVDENQYLQQVVGLALKKCIAEVILHRPLDPIAYLADSLVKYRINIEAQQRHIDNEKARLANAIIYPKKENSTPLMDFELKDYDMTYNDIEEDDY